MLTKDQRNLIDSISTVLEAQPEIEAAWLAGSLGAGSGDRFSDVDTLALVADGTLAAVSQALAGKVGAIAEPALVNVLFEGRVINVVTARWDRFDIGLIEASGLPFHDRAALTPLFNRSGREPPFQPDRAYAPAPETVLKLVREFLRILGLLPVVIGREEYVLALSGIDHLRRGTIDLMLEENGIAPGKRGGALHRNPLLTEEQRRALLALPPLAAERQSTIDGHIAFAALFLPRAKALAMRIGMQWPERFEQVTRAHLNNALGVTF